MTVAAVDRCLRLLEALAATPHGEGLNALAIQLNLPKSAVHRMLATLAERGYVKQDLLTQSYVPTLHLATLGFRCLDARYLPDAAQQVLDDLALETGEYCRLALVNGRDLVWVARAQGVVQGLRYDPPMSRSIALHATASGKAWLSELAEADAIEMACARGLKPPPNAGAHVVRTVDELKQHLVQTRRRGFAIADDEVEAGTLAYAAAFFVAERGKRRVAGTISIAGPHARMRRLKVNVVGKTLLAATRRMADVWPLYARQQQKE